MELLVLSILFGFTLAVPTSPDPSPACTSSSSPPTPTCTTATFPIPTNRVTSFPVCGTHGFFSLNVPCDNAEYLGYYPPTDQPRPVNTTLVECMTACRRNNTCRAILYAEHYQECQLFRGWVKDDQVDADDESWGGFYDRICWVHGS